MAPVRYSLHYEDYSEHLMSRFGKLLQMQSLVDMTLMCSSHTLRVHKAVLAASSAYFQEVLQKQSGEPLIILKIRFSVLKSLVEFMYCGKTQCLEENLDELVSAAQFLKIKGLSKVTKEGLGITNTSELPAFTPPVVINRPPQSLINLQPQDRSNRLPFEIEKNSGSGATNVEFPPKDIPQRPFKPRRGRPSHRPGWEPTTPGALGRAAERALLRREQDSRKAIHQLKHLQTRYSHQEYMDRVAIPQAVNSILPPESSSHSYMNIDSDFMYMDQSVSSNVNMPTIGGDTMTQSYPAPIASSTNSGDISTAMSQYVNALKNAGLPTDLPILFESGDGSYINVNEQVLLDMVQSSEIQYEVIEQPNIIENVADPSEIKSIDDLSKSIERGEMMNKGYGPDNTFDKDAQFNRNDDPINSLNAILPDNLDTFAEQQNYVVLDQGRAGSMVTNDFSSIEDNMQFFTKSMSDDVKKYYQGQQTLDQLCPTSTLDTSFSISLLDTKNPNLDGGHIPQYSSLNPDDLRRQEDCYDFGLPLGQSNDFKGDDLDCLIQTPKRNEDDHNTHERDEIIKDLLNIEKHIGQNTSESITDDTEKTDGDDDNNKVNDEGNIADKTLENVFDDEPNETREEPAPKPDGGILSAAITSSGIEWDNDDDIDEPSNADNATKPIEDSPNNDNHEALEDSPNNDNHEALEDSLNNDNNDDSQSDEPVTNDKDEVKELMVPSDYDTTELSKTLNIPSENWGIADADNNILDDKENQPTEVIKIEDGESTLDDDIPFAVGLCPLKQIQSPEELDNGVLKRKPSPDSLSDINDDDKCLRRKVKKKL